MTGNKPETCLFFLYSSGSLKAVKQVEKNFKKIVLH